MESLPLIAVTSGEPAGIGIEICLKLSQIKCACQLIFFADINLMRQQAQFFNMTIEIIEWHEQTITQINKLYVKHIPLAEPAIMGKLNSANARYVLQTIQSATEYCQQGKIKALVTMPIHKGIINQAGIKFTGHTEYLAELTQAHPVMMLACDELRVALVTTHLPLNKVSEAITAETLQTVIQICQQDLINKFNIKNPLITVCGLNPHAGEDGYLGMEEINIINPTLEKLRQQGINLLGSLPADTAFTPALMAKTDLFLAMYHDQGLTVLKHICFGRAVNVTLGLPIIRTSVDHGTALDIAGQNKANIGSAINAIKYANIK